MESVKNNRRVVIFDKDMLIRRFTTLAKGNCDLLTLSIRDLLKMKLEFPKVFAHLFQDVRKKLNRELGMKIDMIREYEQDMIEKQSTKNALRSKFKINLLGGI